MADRSLRIGVDGRELVGQPTGVGRYLRRVLEEWTRAPDWSHHVTVFLHEEPPGNLRDLPGIDWNVHHADAAGTLWEQTQLPRLLKAAAIDAFFAVGYTAPLRMPCPFVVVVHDVSFVTHPEWFQWREGVRRRWLTRSAAHRAHTVLTVSNFSAVEIVRTLGIPRERIRLAPPGAPAVPPASDAPREPVVLYVGTILNRRHVIDLVGAFPDVRREVADARLALVGVNRCAPPLDPLALAAELGVGDAVTWHAYVDDRALERLYRTASVFAFLSEYEGFAMTPMEALAQGTPLVLLDTPVAREVYGEAALFVPLERGAIVGGLVRLLRDARARAQLLAKGHDRLAAFSWARTAATIRDALERAAAHS
jgi:glycosyltransferase involved in cell wall biosynthesis